MSVVCVCGVCGHATQAAVSRHAALPGPHARGGRRAELVQRCPCHTSSPCMASHHISGLGTKIVLVVLMTAFMFVAYEKIVQVGCDRSMIACECVICFQIIFAVLGARRTTAFSG